VCVHVCVLRMFAHVFVSQTWGDGSRGKLGHGNTTDVAAPQTIGGLNAVVQVAAGGDHTLFLFEDGTVQSVGSGAVGQLGHGDNVDLSTPKMIRAVKQHAVYSSTDKVGFGKVKAIAAGQHHSVALLEDGTVACWGLGIYGQLGLELDGTGSYVNVPTIVPGVSGVTHIEAGSIYTLLYRGGSKDRGEILMKMGQYPHFTDKNQYARITADTTYSSSMVQEAKFWSSPVNEHNGRVHSVSSATRPPIIHWNNRDDVVPTVYGGHDTVNPVGSQNLDTVGPPQEQEDVYAPGVTAMDKDTVTRGQILVQKLEDTSWADADDNPQAR